MSKQQKTRTAGQVIFEINETIDTALADEKLIHLRPNRQDETSAGFYSPYNRSIYKATSPEALGELREAFSALESEYMEIQKDETNPDLNPKTHKNIPVFLPSTVSNITIRKNTAYKGFDIDPDSDYWLCLYSVRLEGRFEDKKEFEFEIQCQHDEVRSLASELREKTNGLLDPKVETDYRTTALLVSHENFWEYAQTLGHDFSRIRVRWETGSQYRAQLHYLDRDPTEERWGVMIVPNDSPLTKRNINFPLPRKPRKGSLNDPEKAFLVEKVGDFTPQVKIYLVK